MIVEKRLRQDRGGSRFVLIRMLLQCFAVAGQKANSIFASPAVLHYTFKASSNIQLECLEDCGKGKSFFSFSWKRLSCKCESICPGFKQLISLLLLQHFPIILNLTSLIMNGLRTADTDASDRQESIGTLLLKLMLSRKLFQRE